jgi:hypothetical protein
LGSVISPIKRLRGGFYFLIEALPSFLLGLFCLYWLSDRPLKTSRFSGIDQEIAEACYNSEAVDKAGAIRKKHIIWTLTDWRLNAQTSIYLSHFWISSQHHQGYTEPVRFVELELRTYGS